MSTAHPYRELNAEPHPLEELHHGRAPEPAVTQPKQSRSVQSAPAANQIPIGEYDGEPGFSPHDIAMSHARHQAKLRGE